MFYFFVKNLPRVVWRVFAFFLPKLWYRANIVLVLWRTVILLSKLGSDTDILSFLLSMSWNTWEFLQCHFRHFLWDIFILFLTTTFLVYADKLPSLNSSGCIWRGSQMVTVSIYPLSVISSITPFMFDSKFTSSIITFCFVAVFLYSYLLANSLF